MTVRTVEEMKAAAEEIAKLGCGAVLVKGGHLGGEAGRDYRRALR